MGARPGVDGPPAGRHIWVVRAGSAEPLHSPCRLTLEDGSELALAGALPPDLPIGYHDLQPDDGGAPTRVIVTPGRCYLPDDLREWVLTVQLPACRSRSSWGMGDAGDLARIGAWARDHGAGMVAINPLHAPLPLPHVEPSPYYPSSRRWRNPLYIRVDDVPGAAGDAEVARMAAEARRLNRVPLVDRDAAWALKQRALERIWSLTGPRRRVRPLAARRRAARSRTTPRSARWPSTTARAGRAGPPSTGTRPSPRWRRSRRPSPTGSGSGRGCSTCWRPSWRRPAPSRPSSPTWPSASTPTAPTPGRCRTSWPTASASAPRPTPWPGAGRTGASRRSSPGSCARPATSRSPACGARR